MKIAPTATAAIVPQEQGERAHLAFIRRWLAFADAGFAGDFAPFFTPDYAGHLSGRIHMDLGELERLEQGFARSFTAVTRTIEDLFAAGEKVVLRLTTRATHSGEFFGVPASGRRVEFAGIVIYRFRGGRIAESFGELDFAGLRRQLLAEGN